MMRNYFIRTIHLTVVMLLTLLFSITAIASMNIEQQREWFRSANKALKSGDSRAYSRLSAKIQDYPLYPYLQFEYLRTRISLANEKEIQNFVKNYADSPLSGRLHTLWLYYLARNKKYEKFLADFSSTENINLNCFRVEALSKTNKISEAEKFAAELWLSDKSQPTECNKIFDWWIARGGLNDNLRWERIRLAMDKGNVTLAKFIAKSMSKDDERWVGYWSDMRSKPAENLHLKIYQVDETIPNRIVRYGVKRLATRDAGAAHDYWETARSRQTKSTADEINELDQYIALQASYQKHPRALEWLSQVDAADETVRTWRIRVALSQQDWWSALTWIEALPEEEKESEMWRYWRARILQLQSESLPALATAAERIFASLSEIRSYHGFLAADRLGVELNFNPAPRKFSQDELTQVENLPGISRAKELFFLGMTVDARREWYYTTLTLNDDQLQKASLLASQWGWHDRAILTAAKSTHFDDLEVRFPVVYKDIILEQAGKQEMDPAWIYGVMRQESSFMSDARSHAGALGLMQIMPRTGRMTARENKVRLDSNKDLLNVEKNIRLGTAYLRRMLEENKGNSVLATASYNAGPYRVRQWLPSKDMPSDIWIETIPFNETRNYVRRVLSYTIIYDHKLDGKITHIRNRMPEIKARNSLDS